LKYQDFEFEGRMKKSLTLADFPLKMQDTLASFERRAFLCTSAKFAFGIVCMETISGLVGCGQGGDGGTGQKGVPSYERNVLLDNFEEQLPFYKTAMSENKDEATVKSLSQYAWVWFENLMTEVPYVGDAQNPLPKTLIQSAVALSFCRSLEEAGEEPEQAGNLIVDAAEISYRAVPEEDFRARGQQQFTEGWYQLQRFAAKKSQERHYGGDWVFNFVEGVPGEFDWGWDFTECGILKLYKAQRAVELVPYLCVLDFIVSNLEGTGLQRTKTLAKGHDCCNFRYRKGREVQVKL
jgi:hypothetical protein